jgi:hypothetical protein
MAQNVLKSQRQAWQDELSNEDGLVLKEDFEFEQLLTEGLNWASAGGEDGATR